MLIKGSAFIFQIFEMTMDGAYSKTTDVKKVLDGMATLSLSTEKPRRGTKVWDSSSCGNASAYSTCICQHDWIQE